MGNTHKNLKTGILGGDEKRTIRIVNYDMSWPLRYSDIEKIVRRALGDVAIAIEHIGSTAVPGLAAKPIIDILLVVEDSADEDQYVQKMELAGFELRVREPEFHEHRMFRTIDRDVHIHVLSDGSSEIDRYLRFRNRLRSSDSDRQDYEKVKLELASSDWDNMDAYARAKTEVIERIIDSSDASDATS